MTQRFLDSLNSFRRGLMCVGIQPAHIVIRLNHDDFTQLLQDPHVMEQVRGGAPADNAQMTHAHLVINGVTFHSVDEA